MPMRLTATVVATLTISFTTVVPKAAAQPAPLEQEDVPVVVDSGPLVNTTDKRATIFSEVIEVPDASWIRLTFDQALLGGAGSVLRITGLQDNVRQHHTARTLQQWRYTSAYFNGNAVRVELIADPGADPGLIQISHVIVGPPDGAIKVSQCGPTDDRLPSDDPRVARSIPVGCTAWMISDDANCFITAGHCFSPNGMQICEFNVPLSSSNGSLNHPPPSDQYPIDLTSVQFVNGGIGNDWCYFGCFANTETGLTAFQTQGEAFDLAATPPPVQGQTIRITGHGTDTSPSTWNQIQQTHTGPYISFSGSHVSYQVDTTGGNSGSPVINDDTGEAIGVHTHGGCNSGGGANNGTGSNNGGLQNALDDPQGICVPMPGLAFGFPDGLPEFLNPAGDSLTVQITGANGGSLEPGTATLHYEIGGGFQTALMQDLGDDLFEATFPSTTCGTLVQLYFSAETSTAELVRNPLLAPSVVYNALSGFPRETESAVALDVETHLGVTQVFCPVGDLDGDGLVTINDMLILLEEWGECQEPCPPSCAADLDGDCNVGIVDFLLLLANWS